MRPPALRASISSAARWRSLCWWQLTVGVAISKVVEQLLRLAGVFAGDAVDALEHVEGAQGDVAQVADGVATR